MVFFSPISCLARSIVNCFGARLLGPGTSYSNLHFPLLGSMKSYASCPEQLCVASVCREPLPLVFQSLSGVFPSLSLPALLTLQREVSRPRSLTGTEPASSRCLTPGTNSVYPAAPVYQRTDPRATTDR